MVFCSLIASSAIRAFISALKFRRCLDFISARFPRQRFYTLMSGPNFGEHFTVPKFLVTRRGATPRRMRVKISLVDVLLIVAFATLFYLRNWQAAFFVVIVLAYAVYRYYKSKPGEPPTDSNEFLVESEGETYCMAELDIGLDYRPKANHFRTDDTFDTSQSKGLYEYRVEGTDVLYRLIEHEYEDVGVPQYQDVRDGVVLESDIRK